MMFAGRRLPSALPAILSAWAAAVAAPAGAGGQGAAREEPCVSCHLELAEISGVLAAPAQKWADDVHRSKGLTCVSCHGGDPSPGAARDADAAMDPTKGFVARPPRARLAEFCGRCHSDAKYMKTFNPAARVDQVTEYRTSVHGVRNAAGDEKVATCINCHDVHGIQPVSSPRSPAYPKNVPATCGKCHADAALMGSYGLRGNPLADWMKSTHAETLLEREDLSAPACNDCHGNHGAAPPGVASLAFVCGQCHAREALLFRDSFKKNLFDETGASECVTCHGNHEIHHPTDRLIWTGAGTVCSQCHAPGDECDKQSVQIRKTIDGYARALGEAQDVLGRAERAGMEVSGAIFTLKKEGISGLVETRALIHSFDAERLTRRAEEGLKVASDARRQGDDALAEVQYRRKGLAVSLVFIGVLLAGLFLKIRDVDRRRSAP